MESPANASPAPDTLMRVGRIFRPHGVHGELKVEPQTDDPARFEELTDLYIGPDDRQVTGYAIESIRYQETKHGITVILKVEGIDSRGDAEVVAKQFVFADEEALPPLDDDEIYIHDLIGLQAFTEEGEAIGMISNVLNMPAQDVFVVYDQETTTEHMIPAVEEFIVDIDLDAERVVVRPIEGLLE